MSYRVPDDCGPYAETRFYERQARDRQYEEFLDNRERYSEWHYKRIWFYPTWHHDDIAEYLNGSISSVGATGPVYPEHIVRAWRRTRDNNYKLFWELLPTRIP